MAAELPEAEKIKRLTMAEHVTRIEKGVVDMMDLLNKDRQNMKSIKQYLSNQVKQYKNESHQLMINLRNRTEKLKAAFNEMNEQEKKDLSGMKVQVHKLSTQHLKLEQQAYRSGELVANAENEIGFKELLKKK